jgi:propanol-preferring alcohol dehydrogenase
MENLCDDFMATGRDANGGYAEYTVVSEDFAYSIPTAFNDSEAAPLLCAGAIGYRSMRLADIHNGEDIGLVGFGASAHLVLGIIRRKYPDTKVFVFARTGAQQHFARQLGASWAGNPGEETPGKLRAIIDTTPSWTPVVKSMKNLEKGGRLIINAIRKEEEGKKSLLGLDYARDLWMEKEIKSVANITRSDVEEFLSFAVDSSLRPVVQEYALEDANTALRELRERKVRGAKVLRMG